MSTVAEPIVLPRVPPRAAPSPLAPLAVLLLGAAVAAGGWSFSARVPWGFTPGQAASAALTWVAIQRQTTAVETTPYLRTRHEILEVVPGSVRANLVVPDRVFHQLGGDQDLRLAAEHHYRLFPVKVGEEQVFMYYKLPMTVPVRRLLGGLIYVADAPRTAAGREPFFVAKGSAPEWVGRVELRYPMEDRRAAWFVDLVTRPQTQSAFGVVAFGLFALALFLRRTWLSGVAVSLLLLGVVSCAARVSLLAMMYSF